MKSFWMFIKDMLSSESEVSSKRVAGFIGWIGCGIRILGWMPDLVPTYLYLSAGLLAAGLAEQLIKKAK